MGQIYDPDNRHHGCCFHQTKSVFLSSFLLYFSTRELYIDPERYFYFGWKVCGDSRTAESFLRVVFTCH